MGCTALSLILCCIATIVIAENCRPPRTTDRPDPPQKLKLSSCTSSKADLSWEPGSENNDEVLEFIIYFNTSFDDDGVFHVASQVGKGIHRTYINLSPWANYTFHVKARNSLGLSECSVFSAVCEARAMIPYQNPKHVCARSERPDQLVIVWDKMEKIDHNGEGFHYVVTYQRTEGMHPQVVERVDDWKQTKLVVDGQPTFVAYEIQVQARNVKGFAPVRTLNRHRVFSGEDTPLDSPQGFQLDKSTLNSTSAEFTWDPVDESPAHVRGHFKGYRIRIWKTNDPKHTREKDIIINPVDMCPVIQAGRRKKRAVGDEVRVHTNQLWPYSALNAGVLVLNGGKTGELSNVISFNTPEALPGKVSRFVISETGSHHLKLVWGPPMEPNGILTGYTMAYREVGGQVIYEKNVYDPFCSHYKIHDLKEETDYIIYLMAKTIVGRGPRMQQESRTLAAGVPDVPVIRVMAPGVDHVNVSWVPSSGRQENPGSEFYIEYKKEGDDGPWQSTDPERQHNWINVTDLEPGATYEVRIVARNGRGDESRSLSATIQIGTKTDVLVMGLGVGFPVAFILIAIVIIIFRVKCRNFLVRVKHRTNEPNDVSLQDVPRAPQPDMMTTDGNDAVPSNSQYSELFAEGMTAPHPYQGIVAWRPRTETGHYEEISENLSTMGGRGHTSIYEHIYDDTALPDDVQLSTSPMTSQVGQNRAISENEDYLTMPDQLDQNRAISENEDYLTMPDQLDQNRAIAENGDYLPMTGQVGSNRAIAENDDYLPMTGQVGRNRAIATRQTNPEYLSLYED